MPELGLNNKQTILGLDVYSIIRHLVGFNAGQVNTYQNFLVFLNFSGTIGHVDHGKTTLTAAITKVWYDE